MKITFQVGGIKYYVADAASDCVYERLIFLTDLYKWGFVLIEPIN